jgi:hypothetical protein
MAGEFARVANDMTARIEKIGINPLRRMRDEGGRMKQKDELVE